METIHELDSGLTEGLAEAPEDTSSDRKKTRKKIHAPKQHTIVTLSFGLLCILLTSVRLDSATPWKEGRKHFLNEFCYWTQEGWMFFDPSLYFVVPTKMNWTASSDYCLQRNSHLVVIDSSGEQGFVSRLGGPAWIGLGEQDTQGTLTWVDGTNMTSSWTRSKPQNESGVAHCVAKAERGQWFEEACDKPHHGICERVVVLDHLGAGACA